MIGLGIKPTRVHVRVDLIFISGSPEGRVDQASRTRFLKVSKDSGLPLRNPLNLHYQGRQYNLNAGT